MRRRGFLVTLASAIAGAIAPSPFPNLSSPRVVSAYPSGKAGSASLLALRHLVWVWNLTSDGGPDAIRDVLAAHGLAVAVKTHDGVEWMSTYDRSRDAVSGPAQIEALARRFDEAGVPFHAWCVVRGLEPKREAELCSDAVSAGARSMIIDLEPHASFWAGTADDAVTFGREFRRRQPNAWVSVSFDPRPWVAERTPLREFAAFSDELAPQLYWDSFNTPPNHERFRERGRPPGPDGVDPKFLMDVSLELLRPYNLPIQPVGQGTATLGAWKMFVDRAFTHGSESVSVWRFGITNGEVWPLLREEAPRPRVYVVQPGDTLSRLAEQWKTSVQSITELNGIENPNLIRVGQKITVPGRGAAGRGAVLAPAAPPASVYVVEAGDSLTSLADRWGTTASAIAQHNGLADPNFIRIGQELRVP